MSLEIIGLINCYLVVYMDSDMEELLLISSPETGEIPVRIVVTNATAVRQLNTTVQRIHYGEFVVNNNSFGYKTVESEVILCNKLLSY